ncbi:hypothetical protein FTUN_1188 [Frigoriglobus tundricola]|uniref:Uncharacterized protein n=1 Tax=Frigoriglobus tundricola TaxID=2774151 RepID=A0A6M5YK15_9BACT|nr:hypothetical protein FTUN_1188 [Frigoriglobus tundricola]
MRTAVLNSQRAGVSPARCELLLRRDEFRYARSQALASLARAPIQ